MILGFAHQDANHRQGLGRVAEQTCKRFTLGPDAVVLVSELACSLPGCPPLETVVVFWTRDGARCRFKIFKPVMQVTEEDLPYAWLMRSLAAPEGSGDDCC